MTNTQPIHTTRMAMCDACIAKFPAMMKGHVLDLPGLNKYGCEVCEGDTDPALWGYGTEAQRADAQWFNRTDY